MPELVIVPHWNNQEGEDFDTTRCWMGEKRFADLADMLPGSATIIGIDEKTACVIDVPHKQATVYGSGGVTFVRARRVRYIPSGQSFMLSG